MRICESPESWYIWYMYMSISTVMFNDPDLQECLTPAGFAKAWSAQPSESEDKHRRQKIRFATAGSTCVDHSAIGSLFLI